MTDSKHRIYYQSGEPVKILENRNRRGIILRQATSVVFIDYEICDQVIDALADLADQIEAEAQR